MSESPRSESLRPREKLPAVAVDSVVAIANPNISTPYSFTVGEKTDMGLMLSHDTKRPAHEADYMIQVDVNHWRSGVLGVGPNGETYDIKGIGWIVPTLDEDEQKLAMAVSEWTTTPGNDEDDVRGLLNFREAKKDYEMGERLHSLGIRTSRTVAVLKLNELVHKHHKYSVADMRLAASVLEKTIGQSGRLPETYEPVLAIRQFGSKMRLDDIAAKHRSTSEAQAEVKSASAYVSREMGLSSPMQADAYLSWFAETLGRNLGRLHGNKLVHKSLHQGNITMDCAIVDLDTVESLESSSADDALAAMRDDIWGTSVDHGGAAKGVGQGAVDSFRMFAARIKELYPQETAAISIESLIETVLKSYIKEYPAGDQVVLARDGIE